MARLIFVPTFALACLLCTAGCAKVPKPSADSTPPILRWHIENLSTNKDVDFTGSADYSAKPGDSLRITLKSEDPEGIRGIAWNGGFTVECRHPEEPLAQNSSGLYKPGQQTLSPDPNNMVLTSIFLVRTFEFDPIPTCRPGLEFRCMVACLYGAGENYFSGVTNEGLRVVISGKNVCSHLKC